MTSIMVAGFIIKLHGYFVEVQCAAVTQGCSENFLVWVVEDIIRHDSGNYVEQYYQQRKKNEYQSSYK